MPRNLPGELTEVLIGALFVAFGIVSIAAGLTARPRRAPIAVWFGVFSLLYGVRLSARSELLQLATAWPDAAFDYTEAFITYVIPVTAGLFTDALVGRGKAGSVRRAWQLTTVYALGACVHDIVRGRPGASMWLNAPVVLSTVSVYVWHVFRHSRGTGRWSPDAKLVAAAAALFTVIAFYETVFRQAPFGIPFNVEPIAMLLLTLALGWFVLSRVGAQAAEFAALNRELRLAQEIQQSLLPRQMPQVPGLRLTGAYLPVSAVAGDFYDAFVRPGGEVVVIVADVSGHGMPAALVASMVKVAFAAEVEREARPGGVLAGINRALSGKFDRAYVTACCVAVRPGPETIAYAAAGHPPAMIRRGSGAVERIDEGGIALTWMPFTSYGTIDVPFGPGDRLLLFTDGLLEASRPGSDEFFGDTELARTVSALGPSEDASRAVLEAHRRWMGAGTPLADDVTLVVIERPGPQLGPAHA